MVGKNCLSPIQILQDISTNNNSFEHLFNDARKNIWYFVFKESFTLTLIYRQSIISLPDFYKTCVLISYKTSNTQSEVEQMSYYVFNNFVAFLNEIIEEENKGQKSDSSGAGSDVFNKAGSFMKGSMSNFKNSLGGSFGKGKLKL